MYKFSNKLRKIGAMNARNQRRMAWSLVAAIYAAAWAGILWLAVTALSGCTRTVYTPVPAVSTEKEDVSKWRVDTVIDSDTVRIVERGDTVFLSSTQWRWRIKEVHDTVSFVRTDSVPVPYPVERKLSRWEQTKQDWGIAITAVAAIISIAVVWLAKKMRFK